MRMWKIIFFVLLALAVQAKSTWTRWLYNTEIGSGSRSGLLVLYPISGPPGSMPRCRSLDAALMQGELTVKEVSEGGDVNRLIVENHGDRPIFIMAGEVLSGARQDRILEHDLFLPVDSGEVTVAAFCVEHGRWSYQGSKIKFDSRGTISNAKVRQAALSTAGQQGVWDSVAETCKSGGVAAPTQALNAVYEDSRLSGRISSMVANLRDLPDDHPEMNGVVVQLGNRIVAVDVFPDRRLLISLWPKLLRSYALEACLCRAPSGSLSRTQVRNFLSDIAEGPWSSGRTPGDGRLYTLHQGARDGQALVLDEGLLHLQVLCNERPRIVKPTPIPSPWPPAIEMVKPTRPR